VALQEGCGYAFRRYSFSVSVHTARWHGPDKKSPG
jgi:hypothetical protein